MSGTVGSPSTSRIAAGHTPRGGGTVASHGPGASPDPAPGLGGELQASAEVARTDEAQVEATVRHRPARDDRPRAPAGEPDRRRGALERVDPVARRWQSDPGEAAVPHRDRDDAVVVHREAAARAGAAELLLRPRDPVDAVERGR